VNCVKCESEKGEKCRAVGPHVATHHTPSPIHCGPMLGPITQPPQPFSTPYDATEQRQRQQQRHNSRSVLQCRAVRSFVRAPSLVLIHVLGMHNTQVSCQCVVPAECLLLGAQRTMHLLLPGIVDGILVPGQIVRPREDRVARLARRGIDSLTLCQVSMRFRFLRCG
jgi:hypothetical protein